MKSLRAELMRQSQSHSPGVAVTWQVEHRTAFLQSSIPMRGMALTLTARATTRKQITLNLKHEGLVNHTAAWEHDSHRGGRRKWGVLPHKSGGVVFRGQRNSLHLSTSVISFATIS